jgi:hypothetical protein
VNVYPGIEILGQLSSSFHDDVTISIKEDAREAARMLIPSASVEVVGGLEFRKPGNLIPIFLYRVTSCCPVLPLMFFNWPFLRVLLG